jgi:UDP-glucuronate decarboxylase
MMNGPDDFVGPINLGNPHEYSIRTLAETIIRLIGSNSSIVLRPLPEDDPKRRRPDITLAQERLSWKPEINLEQGLEKTIQYFKEIL